MDDDRLTLIDGKHKEYFAPKVEIVEVKVEKGFAGSGNENGQLPGWKPTYW